MWNRCPNRRTVRSREIISREYFMQRKNRAAAALDRKTRYKNARDNGMPDADRVPCLDANELC